MSRKDDLYSCLLSHTNLAQCVFSSYKPEYTFNFPLDINHSSINTMVYVLFTVLEELSMSQELIRFQSCKWMNLLLINWALLFLKQHIHCRCRKTDLRLKETCILISEENKIKNDLSQSKECTYWNVLSAWKIDFMLKV